MKKISLGTIAAAVVTGRETIAVAVVVVATAATGVEAATIDIMGKFMIIILEYFCINDYGFHNLIYMHAWLEWACC